MKRTLLIGPAGCGKTHRILDLFEESLRRASDPLAPESLLILPSAEHMDRAVLLLLQRGVKGFFHRRITTLSNLLKDFFESPAVRVASPVSRYGILREVFETETWPYFERVQKSPGFLNLMGNFLAEVKDSLIGPSDFRSRMNAMKKLEAPLGAKYEALAGIYEAYETGLRKRGFVDFQDAVRIRREGGVKKAAPRIKKLFLDGFFDFTPLQAEALGELFAAAGEAVVTLTRDTAKGRPELFEAVAKTETLLRRMGFEPELLKRPCPRFKKPALAYLEENLFRESLPAAARVPKAEAAETIRLFEAVGMQGEVEMIAREILRISRTEDFRLSDFAVLLRQIGPYEALIRSVFRRFGIPVEIHERERLKLSPMIQTAAALVKIFRDGWRREELVNFLKSSYVRFLGKGSPKDYEWVSELENRAYLEGLLRGREEWLKAWPEHSGAPGSGRENSGPSFHERKTAALGVLAALEDRLRSAPDFRSLREFFVEALFKTFGIFAPSVEASEAVRREAASFKRLQVLLDEIEGQSEARAEGGVNFQDFCDQFLRLLDLDLYSLGERHPNRVQVYDVSLARQKEYRVVFAAGLLERNFPVHVREDPVLSDWERRLFNSGAESGFLAERLPRQNLERYLFYLALTRARERLVLSCPRFDLEGKESLPSFYLEEVRRLFPGKLGTVKQDLSHPYPGLEEASSPRELETALMGELWHLSPRLQTEGAFVWTVLNKALENPATRGRFQKACVSIDARIADPEIAASDPFRSRRSSASRLEEYAKCPYRYFANQVLGLEDPREDVNARQKGTIMHQVLERYGRARFQAREARLRGRDAAREFCLRELDQALQDYPLIRRRKYELELDYEELQETLLRFLDFELARFETAPLLPKYFEFSFGTSGEPDAPALEIRDGERVMNLTGKIDRIDVDPEGRFGLVFDYKRNAEFKREGFESGASLQLQIYLLAMREFLKLEPVGGQLLSLTRRKSTGFYHKENASSLGLLPSRAFALSGEDYEKAMERSLGHIKRFGRAMEACLIPPRPRTPEECKKCLYPGLCRIEKWRLPMIREEIRAEEAREETAGRVRE